MATYVMSDIHGHEERFNSILNQINLTDDDTLYVLGDVIDRNPGGIKILQQIMEMPNAHMLLGNHEFMMLDAYGVPYDDVIHESSASLWFQNGGNITHEEFKKLNSLEKTMIINFLKALPLKFDININGQRFILVHACDPDLREFSKEGDMMTDAEFAVWNRDILLSYGNYMAEANPDLTTKYVYGHTPTYHIAKQIPMEIVEYDNTIGIDCGAYTEMPGCRLACLRLDDMAEFYAE